MATCCVTCVRRLFGHHHPDVGLWLTLVVVQAPDVRLHTLPYCKARQQPVWVSWYRFNETLSAILRPLWIYTTITN